MATQRIKGQEVQVIIVDDGVMQDTITDVRSFEVEIQTELKSEGYLGETTNRRDEIFNGIRGKMELHIENKDIFTLIQSVTDRARRRTPGALINIKATLNFPNGDRPLLIVKDVFFGPMPLNFASRSDYGAVSLDFEAAEFKIV